jgi:hypothetical protein
MPKSNYQFISMYDHLPTYKANNQTTLPTYVPNYIEKGPSSEAYNFSTIQEILHILFNLKANYYHHNNPPLAPFQPDKSTPLHSISSIPIL